MPMLATVDGSSFFIYLAIGIVAAVVAYRSSEAYKSANHVTPWHVPSIVWAIIGFVSWLLCVILFLIARKTTKPVAASALQSQVPVAGWYPDPTAQHELRFWDGSQWTSRVEDGGVELASES